MENVTGSSSRARSLNNIEPVGPLTAGRLLVLIGLGVATVLLHRTFRYPLQLPGHHGLESMALLAFGRLICTDRWAGTIVGASTAMSAIALDGGFHEGWSGPFLDFLPGFALDLALMAIPAWRDKVFLLPFVVALAFAMKPAFKLIGAELLGLQFGALRHGFLYPFSTHLMYGLMGSTIAVVAWRGWARLSEQQRKS